MENNLGIPESIKNAYEVLSGALDSIDEATQAGFNIHPSISNRMNTAKLILAEVMDEFSISVGLNTHVREFYLSAYPDDNLGPYLQPGVTFGDIVNHLNDKQDIYEALGPHADTVIRERVFSKIAQLLDVDYRMVYKKWVDPNEYPALITPDMREASNRAAKLSAPNLISSKTLVSCIRKGEDQAQEVPFESIRNGDTFFVNGEDFIVKVDSHYSGDASYDGYLLYDEQGNSWFPEDLDSNVQKSRPQIVTDNPKRSLDAQIHAASQIASNNISHAKAKEPAREI